MTACSTVLEWLYDNMQHNESVILQAVCALATFNLGSLTSEHNLQPSTNIQMKMYVSMDLVKQGS
jgi:hypothetical protein